MFVSVHCTWKPQAALSAALSSPGIAVYSRLPKPTLPKSSLKLVASLARLDIYGAIFVTAVWLCFVAFIGAAPKRLYEGWAAVPL